MLQTIQDLPVYVVDLTAGLPELPIHSADFPALKPYAEALELALLNGTIKEPGKYAIHISYVNGTASSYLVFAVQE